MQKDRTRLKRHSYLLACRLAVVWIEDGFTSHTAFGGGRQVEEQRPSGADGDWWLGGKDQVVGVIVWSQG